MSGRRRALVLIAVLSLAAGAAGCGNEVEETPFVTAAARDADCPGPRAQFSGGADPPACWRPYSDASPFNRAVPPNPPLAARSAQIIRRLTDWGPPQRLAAGHAETGSDYFHPVYWSRRGDPVFKVHCLMYDRCAIEGHAVRIPDAAKPAGGEDGHLGVIDARSGWEYDFWQVRSKPRGGGRLTVSYGGRTRIDGKGLGGKATAAWFGLAAGLIRGPEMSAGRIDHAIFAAIRCTSGGSAYPAHRGTSGAPCSSFGQPVADAPPLGSRIWLDLSDEQIARLQVANWKKTILLALHRYGMIVGDTTGGDHSWGLLGESGSSYTSFGRRDPWAAFAARITGRDSSDGYSLDFGDAVDWSRHLHVLHPCVSRGRC